MRSISFFTSIKFIPRSPRALDLSVIPLKLETVLCFNVYLSFPMHMLISLGLKWNSQASVLLTSNLSVPSLSYFQRACNDYFLRLGLSGKWKQKDNSGIWFDIIFNFLLCTFYTFWHTAMIPTNTCKFCLLFFFVIWNCCVDFFHFLCD